MIMLAAVVIFEVFSSMALSRIGASLGITLQIFAWECVATAQAAIRDKVGLYVTRFLLGVGESGYLAAASMVLSSY